MSIFGTIFGDWSKRVFDKYVDLVSQINGLESQFAALSDEALRAKTQEFRERLTKDETLDDLLPEVFAAVREAAKRTIGQRHYDVQLIGGMVLHEGKIAEMKTGEGKTLAATLAIYLNALEGKGVHVVTVNDYLAKRDCNWMGPIYKALGLSVASIQHEKAFLYEPKIIDKDEVTVEMQNLVEVPRAKAYQADITYGTNSEFGFDYLRDNMVDDLSQTVQRGHRFAIVDEVDSILIDEARTPLIISAPDIESTKLYETFSRVVRYLKENADYNLDEKMRTATLTEEGIEKVEKMLGLGNIYTEGGVKYVHHLEQALRAETLFKRDKDYVVKDGEVLIVDEFTGRLMPGRRYSEGLHQALEAREGVKVQRESRTFASVTFQNYFRIYKKLAGMTGTAYTSAEEFSKVYNLEVVQVPTNQPMIRVDISDSVYRTERGKFQAVVREIKKLHEAGQPVLVGTASIERNEILGALLQREGIPHEILNAKNHEREAQIIARAGQKGAVTIATNMAGRGVDIILGGRSESIDEDPEWQKNHDEIVKLGGLRIVGTERHEARRIDNQLRGRAGRQGDPGSSQFFISLEDDLMRIFAPDRIKRLMEVLQVPEDQPIENKMISRAIESAQAKIEGFHFDSRKHVLEYDDVMNKHRETIYRKRREILEAMSAGEVLTTVSVEKEDGDTEELFEKEISLQKQVWQMIENEVRRIVEFHTAEAYRDGWNFEEIFEALNTIYPVSKEARDEMKNKKTREELADYLVSLARSAYEQKEKQVGAERMRQVEKYVYLRTIDMFWMDHLDEMDHLRDSVRLRAYGQKDPLVEYKNEGHRLFQQLLEAIRTSFVATIYKVQVAPMGNNQQSTTNNQQSMVDGRSMTTNKNMPAANQPLGKHKKVGRNDPCPCGSGKKYKRCHGA